MGYVKSSISIDAKRANSKGVTNELIKDYLNIWVNEQRELAIKNISNHITYRNKNNLVEIFVEAITGIKDELVIAILTHFLANIKRKINGKYVKEHIMPVLFGKTGCGKSVAIHRLIFPLKDLSLEAELAIVNDSRQDFNYVEKAIIFFDELAESFWIVGT